MSIINSLMTPILAIKQRYIPLLLIYFAYGASGFSSIAEAFWVKKHLSLGSTDLIALGVWLTFPWTIKMIFGQMIDSIPIFGSNRKIYVFIGAGLIAIGTLIMVAIVGNYPLVHEYNTNKLYIIASVISVVGFVIQDVVADTMSTEVVDRTKPQAKIDKELATIQVLAKISLGLALFIVAGLGGWLLEYYSYETIFKISLLVPILSIIGVALVQLDRTPATPLNHKIFFGGVAFALFTILIGYHEIPYSQEIVFVVSLGVVLYMLSTLIKDLPTQTIKYIISAMTIIFVYRAMPSVGPALQWWEIDILKFDESFFGTLAQIGAAIALIGMWISSKYIIEQSITKVLVFLTILGFFLSLPTIGLYYGVHTYLGIDARTVALVDTAVSSPFAYISAVLMLTLVAIYAPSGNRGTWFALMASLMNIALSAGGLLSKYLNQIFEVTREIKNNGAVVTPANYDQLGILLWITTILGLVVPLFVIYKFRIKKER